VPSSAVALQLQATSSLIKITAFGHGKGIHVRQAYAGSGPSERSGRPMCARRVRTSMRCQPDRPMCPMRPGTRPGWTIWTLLVLSTPVVQG
jgi:hypothetical protein